MPGTCKGHQEMAQNMRWKISFQTWETNLKGFISEAARVHPRKKLSRVLRYEAKKPINLCFLKLQTETRFTLLSMTTNIVLVTLNMSSIMKTKAAGNF